MGRRAKAVDELLASIGVLGVSKPAPNPVAVVTTEEAVPSSVVPPAETLVIPVSLFERALARLERIEYVIEEIREDIRELQPMALPTRPQAMSKDENTARARSVAISESQLIGSGDEPVRRSVNVDGLGDYLGMSDLSLGATSPEETGDGDGVSEEG